MSRRMLTGLLCAAALTLTACEEEETSFPAPGLAEAVDAAELSIQGFAVIPAVLEQVYTAFGATEEDAIYDGLAQVAAGDALEALYLERIGAMAAAGLEPDQEIHEMELLDLSAQTSGRSVDVSARWRVLGTVGHAEHLHVRGNAYAADLTLEPVDEAWRLTAFTLTDVDRTDAGTTQLRSDVAAPADVPWIGGAPGAAPEPAPEITE
ncbi:MAG: hypothetical protein ACU0DW_02835 [Shimia sp.]